MIGALIGDVVGSMYEFTGMRGYSLPLFPAGSGSTDDSVLIAATVDAIKNNIPFPIAYRMWFWKFRGHGFSEGFVNWALDEGDPGLSEGNGGAVRGVAVGNLAASLDEAIDIAYKAGICSHSAEAAKYTQAVSISVYMSKRSKSYNEIAGKIKEVTGISITVPDIDDINKRAYDTSLASETVPLAIWMGLAVDGDFEDCLRRGIYIGGDTDTILTIACGIAEHRAKIPAHIREEALKRIPDEIKLITGVEKMV